MRSSLAERIAARIAVLGRDPARVAALLRARGLDAVVEELAGSAPRLFILDQAPGMVAEVKRRDPAVPVLVVVVRHDTRSVLSAFAAGADDVLAGSARGAELAARARALLRRAGPTLELTGPGPRTALSLSPREGDLLARLASAPGRVLTKRELLADTATRGAGARSLERHMGSLRRKLAGRGATLVTVWGVGYRLDITSSQNT